MSGEMDLAFLKDRRILITGAGGSVGRQLARKLFSLGCEQLVLLDRDGSHLHTLELELLGTGLLSDERFVLADIRDREALAEVFAKYVPSVVIHAAALKHVPLLERFPAEAWKTNVLGTVHLLSLAKAFNVGTFLHISTDKAADPTTVLGKSKHLAERLVTTAGLGQGFEVAAGGWEIQKTDPHPKKEAGRTFSEGAQQTISSHAGGVRSSSLRYVNVRFGNVVGSRGSVSETFKFQIERGLPLTITTEEASRFLMSLEEACELVLLSIGKARNGQTAVLKMGQEVPVVKLAEQVMDEMGVDVPLVFTGPRRGDKTREVLVGAAEVVVSESERCWFIKGQPLDVGGVSFNEVLLER
ncbi:polysaccharide biosynthesis protein [Gleimia sp. 6138-11-ORH1]|uniref:polysaccharide biosynthesis protein n=1 Tax=Gleimia sp. 6138-11-ORH1 TaxID=2973937 RepID=UPI0021672FF3|nr:polysaccharide biosynthesis protein [Gleimia sp. 6138-11-ORH1]MCS4484816.1 polysaccharide biosynthesis protein [Gleimia sp. 6138-11-ORH1]